MTTTASAQPVAAAAPPPAERRCPSCGTAPRDGATCRDAFDRLLAYEFAHPPAFAVHQLTVAAWSLQHWAATVRTAIDAVEPAR